MDLFVVMGTNLAVCGRLEVAEKLQRRIAMAVHGVVQMHSSYQEVAAEVGAVEYGHVGSADCVHIQQGVVQVHPLYGDLRLEREGLLQRVEQARCVPQQMQSHTAAAAAATAAATGTICMHQHARTAPLLLLLCAHA